MAVSKNNKAKPTAARMFALPPTTTDASAATTPVYTLNSLPARILHDGPMPLAPRHWDPQPARQPTKQTLDFTDPSQPLVAQPALQVHTAYLRGRKLLGIPLPLPPTHTATLLRVTEKTQRDTTLRDDAMQELESRRAQLDSAEYAEELEELRAADARGELSEDVGVMELVGSVDDCGVWAWGHEAVAGQSGDGGEEGGLIGGRLGEWVKLAGAMNAY